MKERIRRWWLFAEHLCARVATPKTDIALADREVEAIIRRSWLGSRGESLVCTVHAAWLDSRCRRLTARLAGRL